MMTGPDINVQVVSPVMPVCRAIIFNFCFIFFMP